jgi:hypothetical protein
MALQEKLIMQIDNLSNERIFINEEIVKDKLKDKTLILFSGATNEEFDEMPLYKQKEIRKLVAIIMKYGNPNKIAFISNGQNEILNNELIKQQKNGKAFESVAVISRQNFDENNNIKIDKNATTIAMKATKIVDNMEVLLAHENNAIPKIVNKLQEYNGKGLFVSGSPVESNQFIEVTNAKLPAIQILGFGGAADKNANIQKDNITKIDFRNYFDVDNANDCNKVIANFVRALYNNGVIEEEYLYKAVNDILGRKNPLLQPSDKIFNNSQVRGGGQAAPDKNQHEAPIIF